MNKFMDKLLAEAIETIQDLLKDGRHEGECDNIGNEAEDPCELHLKVSCKRKQNAENFLIKIGKFLVK